VLVSFRIVIGTDVPEQPASPLSAVYRPFIVSRPLQASVHVVHLVFGYKMVLPIRVTVSESFLSCPFSNA
jgi:hypothetical protein